MKIEVADLMASKIRYSYINSPEYREKIKNLIDEAQVNIQLPLFSLIFLIFLNDASNFLNLFYSFFIQFFKFLFL